MNWRLIISNPRSVEALATALRIALVLSAIGLVWFGYSFYAAAVRVSALRSVQSKGVKRFEELRRTYDIQVREVGSVSHEQLVSDAYLQFAGLLAEACRSEGVRLVQLQTEAMERTPTDNLEGGGVIRGWKSLSHTVEIEGRCVAVHAVLARIGEFPMPLELSSLEIKRVGLVGKSESLIRAAFVVDVFQPGTAGTTQQTGGSS